MTHLLVNIAALIVSRFVPAYRLEESILSWMPSGKAANQYDGDHHMVPGVFILTGTHPYVIEK